jgi:hypothetical protein
MVFSGIVLSQTERITLNDLRNNNNLNITIELFDAAIQKQFDEVRNILLLNNIAFIFVIYSCKKSKIRPKLSDSERKTS